MRGVEGGGRNRIVDAVLVALIVVAAVWLGRLVYHNYFGGHADSVDNMRRNEEPEQQELVSGP